MEAEIPVVSSKEDKSFITELSEMDEGICDVIIKTISNKVKAFDQIAANNLSQKKIPSDF